MVDRAGAEHADWGTPVTEITSMKMLQGKWISFDKLEEAAINCGSSSIFWFEDVVFHVIRKEDGPDVARNLAPKVRDPLSVFLESRPAHPQAPLRPSRRDR